MLSSSRLGAFAQISEINDHLYLSGAQPLRPDRIRQKKINCIINATIDEPTMYIPGVDCLKIRVDDSPYARLDAYFDMAADRIKAVRDNGGKALVHCVAGVSRSASLCIAYLMKYERMTLRDAYYRVKSARSIIRPNNGFWSQLVDYERKLFGRNTVKMLPTKFGEEMPDVYANPYDGGREYSSHRVVPRRSVTVAVPSHLQRSVPKYTTATNSLFNSFGSFRSSDLLLPRF